MGNKFFSLAELKQPVNQWLGIAFISLLCFWVVLYYLVNKTEAMVDEIVQNRQEALK